MRASHVATNQLAAASFLAHSIHSCRFAVSLAAGNDARVGARLYTALHEIIRASEGPYLMGEDGGPARGGDGGQRARKKAEEHAAAEAAKWGR